MHCAAPGSVLFDCADRTTTANGRSCRSTEPFSEFQGQPAHAKLLALVADGLVRPPFRNRAAPLTSFSSPPVPPSRRRLCIEIRPVILDSSHCPV